MVLLGHGRVDLCNILIVIHDVEFSYTCANAISANTNAAREKVRNCLSPPLSTGPRNALHSYNYAEEKDN